MTIILFAANVALAQQEVLEKTLSVSFLEEPISNVLDQISEETGFFFSYNSNLFQDNQRFTLTLQDRTLNEVLMQLLKGTGLTFKVYNDQIILYRSNEAIPVPSYTITGIVRDKFTSEPVTGVNVFIAGTLKGSSTNFDGVYKIKDVDPGNFELAASHISYDIAVSRVEINGDDLEMTMDFKLNPKVNQLKELKVVSLKYKEWEKHYSIFKQEFLGSTHNAKRCEILNPEVLDFVFNDQKRSIVVKAYKPLIIINTALGYELDYYLEYFEIGGGNTRSTGISNFKELEPKNEREKRRWNKNRLKSYQGSLTHFLRTIVSGDLEDEGFRIFAVRQLPETNEDKSEELDMDAIVMPATNGTGKQIKFDNYLKIVYTKEMESSAYVDDQIRHAMGVDPYVKNYYNSVRRGVSLGKQTSFMRLNFPSVTINSKGFFKEPLAVTTFGYWSWERVAEYLPIEYKP